MGRRDFRHRESRKSKKNTKEISPVTLMSSSVPVEVVRKKKKKRKEVEAEE